MSTKKSKSRRRVSQKLSAKSQITSIHSTEQEKGTFQSGLLDFTVLCHKNPEVFGTKLYVSERRFAKNSARSSKSKDI